MGTFVKTVVHGPINEANQLGWTYADKKANRALEQLQSKGAKVLDVEVRVETRGRFGSTIIYQITYKAEKPFEVGELQESK